MIDDFRALAVFVAVADAGGFSQAGRELGLSTSVISHHVGRLETKLGVSLFFRSTRSMSLTPEGQKMLHPARRMVGAGREALDVLAETSEQPVGALRIALPAFRVESDIHQRIWAFIREHQMVAVTLHESDEQIDLIKAGFDLAIRLGTLADSSLKSRKVGEFHRILVASPAYLKTIGPMRSLDDLRRAEFISYSMLSDRVTLARGTQKVEFVPELTRIEVNSVAAMKSAIVAGLGIQRMPLSEVEQELASGDLVRVAPDWALPVLGVYAVWPEQGPQRKLTRRFIDYIA